MDTAPISPSLLLASLAVVVLLEAAVAGVGARMQLPRIWLIGIARMLQIVSLIGMASVFGTGPSLIGLERKRLARGLKTGLIWSAIFAAATGLLFLCLFLAGRNPIQRVHTPLPATVSHRVMFFLVGGIIGPVAEEIFFRGLIFGYLRRWNVPAAVLISTALFAALHLPTIPLTQIVGGAIFAIAYQTGGSLMVPIVIHMLGNLAIFTLSLPYFSGF